MTNSSNNSYDLEERTSLFGEKIILLCKRIKKDDVNSVLLNQLIRSGTSIGANYCEANGASSKKDFKNKIHICQKEAKETKHWLRMLAVAVPAEKDHIRDLWKECNELSLIFGKVIATLKN